MISCTEGVLDAGLAARMLKWRHSGLSVHNRIHARANDAKGRQRLTGRKDQRYIGAATGPVGAFTLALRAKAATRS